MSKFLDYLDRRTAILVRGKDENLRLQNLWDAIEIYAAVLTNL